MKTRSKWSRAALFFSSAIAVSAACGPADEEDSDGGCAARLTTENCETAAGCGWAQLINYGESCEVAEDIGVCVAISGTEAGCQSTCDDEVLRFVGVSSNGTLEALVLPESYCGQRPTGSWETCLEAEPGTCGCSCDDG